MAPPANVLYNQGTSLASFKEKSTVHLRKRYKRKIIKSNKIFQINGLIHFPWEECPSLLYGTYTSYIVWKHGICLYNTSAIQFSFPNAITHTLR